MVEVKNLTKSYDGKRLAVNNVSFEIEKGDIFGFIGHNGAGKTTTIKAMMGLLEFEGDIIIDGVSIKKDRLKCKKVMAYVPDNPDIYEYLTGVQFLEFVADIYRVKKDRRKELIKKYADLLELTPFLGNLINSYSHGMKQKLVLISAFIHDPLVIVFDEPFVGLDPKAMHSLKEVMKELCTGGVSIFFSTHVLDTAEKLCNKVGIIKDGMLIACGNTYDVTNGKTLEERFLDELKE